MTYTVRIKKNIVSKVNKTGQNNTSVLDRKTSSAWHSNVNKHDGRQITETNKPNVSIIVKLML